MEYLKLTAIMKEKNGQLAGIVSLQKINGDVILDWSVGQLSQNDELVFTMQDGKKLQFSSLAKRGKKKVFNVCNEFQCEMMRGGKAVASGRTSKYIKNDMDVINYVNTFANNAAAIAKVYKDEDIEKIGDAFDGKVATYNYYENELPKGVANDASAIVNRFENKTTIQSKAKAVEKLEDEVKAAQKLEDTAKAVEKLEDEVKTVAKKQPTKENDEQQKPKKKTDEKDVRTDKNLKIPSIADEESKANSDDDLSYMEINDENTDKADERNRQEIEDSTDQIFGGIPKNEKKKDETSNENSVKGKDNKKKQTKIDNEDESDRENDLTKKWNDNGTFYEGIKEQLDDLFAKFPKDAYLNEIIPSSKWAKVTYDESGRTYSVGILTDGEDVLFVGYGVIAEYSPEPPKELNQNAQWVPLNFAKPHAKGYWMLYQSAKDGTNV